MGNQDTIHRKALLLSLSFFDGERDSYNRWIHTSIHLASPYTKSTTYVHMVRCRSREKGIAYPPRSSFILWKCLRAYRGGWSKVQVSLLSLLPQVNALNTYAPSQRYPIPSLTQGIRFTPSFPPPLSSNAPSPPFQSIPHKTLLLTLPPHQTQPPTHSPPHYPTH